MNKESIYLDWSKIFGYNTNIIAVVGARGIGKTYGVKRKLIKDLIHRGKKFIWIRDTGIACEELSANDGAKFFEDVSAEFKKLEGKIKGETITINGKHAGYLMPASTYYKYKGNAYSDIETIVFDEFIAENGQRSNPHRARAFINTLETIGRLRTNYKVIMLANALDRGDEILQVLGFNIKDYGNYIDRKKSIFLKYADNNPAFNDARDESIVGKLLKGTVYDENISHGMFTDDTELYFSKKPTKCKLWLILHGMNDSVKIMVDTNSERGLIYVCRDIRKDVNIAYRCVSHIQLVDSAKPLIVKTSRDKLKELMACSMLRFESPYCYTIFKECMK